MDKERPPELPPAALAEDLCDDPRRKGAREITRLRRPARRTDPNDDSEAA